MFFRRRPSLASRTPQLTKGPRRQKRRQENRDTRLGLERLEDRQMLAATYVFTNVGDIDIPGAGTEGPASTYPSNIAVSGLAGRVVDVDVTLNGFTNANPGDVDILLVSPSGTASILMSDQGGAGNVNGLTLTFDDESPSVLPIDIPIVAGIYTPSNAETNNDNFDAPAPSGPYVSSLAVHDGVTPNGNWQLFIMDDAIGGIGSIESWSLKLTVLGPDEFEGLGGNDTLATATVLGSEPAITIRDLTIDNFDEVADQDWYRVTANQTGKLIVNTLFVHDDGDIDFNILDSGGNQITAAGSATNNEQAIIPVVAQEQYFIQVFGFAGSPNFYDLEIENFAAPAPTSVDLSPASDTGSSNSDNITSDTTPTLFIQADLVDFKDMGITLLDQGTIDPNNDGDAADASNDGAGVFVTFVNLGNGVTTEGFANQVGASGFLWTFTPPIPLADGDYFVSSAVQVVDGQQDPNRENGRAQLSDPLFITIDTGDAEILANADLLNSSDTGMVNTDNVTNKMQPAFQGIAAANSIVRLFANGELVGQTIAGSDTSDVGVGGVNGEGGASDDGLGLWEITTEPLADNGYDITLEIEDGAGNVTSFDPEFNAANPEIDIVIDTEAPNTPLLDLQNDTGENLSDEITSDNTPNVFMTTTDPNITLAQLLFQDNLKFRLYDRFENNPETLIYNSAVDAAADNTFVPGDMFTSLTALTKMLPFGGGVLADGTHNFKLEVEDRAGNISPDFLLEVVIDTVAPTAVQPNLLDSSDSGMFNDDNVTNKWEPAFDGEAEINNKVFVYAALRNPADGMFGDPTLVGTGLVGSENSNDVPGDGLGRWEVTVEPLIEGVYDFTVRFEDWAGNFTPLAAANALPLRVVIDKTEPNTPYLDLVTDPLLGDTGRSDVDNITKTNTPLVTLTTTDPNIEDLAQVLFDDNLKFRIYDRFESFLGQNTPEFLLYNSAADAAVDNVSVFGDMFTSLTLIEETLPVQFFTLFGADGEAVLNQGGVGVLADGVHNLKLEVEDRAGNISQDFLLEITIDTAVPPVSFGLPDTASEIDGLAAESDSGVTTLPATFADRITNDSTPKLWGRAEANSIINVYFDRNADGIIDKSPGADVFLGQTVAVPFDGNDAYPDGYWEITSILDLNQISGMPKDGLRRLLVTAEDVAGNPMPMGDTISENVDELHIFIDTQGPQITNVQIADELDYNLFTPKQNQDGFTPLINSLKISARDLPSRVLQALADNTFTHDGLVAAIAQAVGNYSVIGDNVGTIAIQSIAVMNASPADIMFNGILSTVTSTSVVRVNGFVGAASQPQIGDYVLFNNGAAVGQARRVDQYNAITGEITFDTPLLNLPAVGNSITVTSWATAMITINFFEPLPDDRFTLTVSDNLVDTAGNNLDGESDASQPLLPSFPSGDGVPGGDFVARFTVDSRPEIGSFVAQNINLDINGNFVWDPAGVPVGGDTTNVDISFTLPVANANGSIAEGGYNVHDLAFAGKFYTSMAAGNQRLFDQLAAYGWSSELGARRWIIDTDSDGVVTLGTDILTFQPDIPGFDVAAAIPVAGNFDDDLNNGDEIGLYYAGRWAFDTNRNFVIEPGEVGAQGNLFGHPIVGDFDGNGTDDQAVFNNNEFFFDLNGDFNYDRTLVWGFPGVLDRPVAADMDQDGIDDIGLWVPRDSAGGTRPSAEWYFLLSSTGGAPGFPLDHAFTPVPFGKDIYAEFGDELALPIVGNFDPPVVASGATSQTTDFDGDGTSSGIDFLSWQLGFGMNAAAGTAPSTSDGDANGDGMVNDYDLDMLMSDLGTASAQAANAGSGFVADFNDSGSVGGDDLTAWKAGLGTVADGNRENGDANQDGVVTGLDFLSWQRFFGAPTVVASATASASTSEPPTASLLAQIAPVEEPTTEISQRTLAATTIEVSQFVQPSEVILAAEVILVEPTPVSSVRSRPQVQLASQVVTTTSSATRIQSFEVAALDSVRTSRAASASDLKADTLVKDEAFELMEEDSSEDLTPSIPRRRPEIQTLAALEQSEGETAEEESWELAFSDDELLARTWR